LSNTAKKLKIFVLVLLSSALFVAAINSGALTVKAQGTDTVVVYSSVGGTTSPDAGTYTYADGSTQTFTATDGNGFIFQYWEIVTAAGGVTSTDNPLDLILNQSAYALQATFEPIIFTGPVNKTIDMSTDAIVVVLGAVGGTVSPAPGTYALASATTLNLLATPTSGWTFSHWIIGGTPMNHGAYSFTDTPTDNPYNVNHGYGNTYSYQAVFTPTSSSSSSPTPKVPEFSSAAAALVAAILVIVAFGAYTYTKKTRK
jgi:hypothetical protein